MNPSEHPGPTRPVRGRRWELALVAVAVLLVVAVGGSTVWSLYRPPAPGSTTHGQASYKPESPLATTRPPSAPASANDVLDTLAHTLTNTGYDTETGRYTFLLTELLGWQGQRGTHVRRAIGTVPAHDQCRGTASGSWPTGGAAGGVVHSDGRAVRAVSAP